MATAPAEFPPVHYINLDRRTDRRAFQERQARLHGIDLSRVPAKDGRQGVARLPESELTPGARGLWITFADLIADLRDRGIPVAVILEDDAVLHPRFSRNIANIISQSPQSAALIQAGFIGLSAWRPNNSAYRNVKKFLRPRSRIKEALRTVRSGRAGRGLFAQDILAGTHCLVVFPERLIDHLHRMEIGKLPLDRALVLYAKEHDGVLLRSRKNLAYQLPFESDIPWERRPR